MALDPEGAPMKTGLPLFGLTSGLHGVIGILTSPLNKHMTGLGQHVNITMIDVAAALLCNQGMNFMVHTKQQKMVGNNHQHAVPCQVMPASAGYFMLNCFE